MIRPSGTISPTQHADVERPLVLEVLCDDHEAAGRQLLHSSRSAVRSVPPAADAEHSPFSAAATRRRRAPDRTWRPPARRRERTAVRMTGEECYSVHNDTDAEAELPIFS